MGKLQGIILGLLLFSGIVIGISVFIGDITTNYGVNTASIAFLNRTTTISNQINDLSNQTVKSLNPSEVTAFNPLPAINAIKLSGQSISIITSLVGSVSDPNQNGGVTYVSIPAWLATIIIFSITLIVIFATLRAWLKVDV